MYKDNLTEEKIAGIVSKTEGHFRFLDILALCQKEEIYDADLIFTTLENLITKGSVKYEKVEGKEWGYIFKKPSAE